jgi:hydroxymethylpyrimidine/phosphomethylpyrimidine kinase
MPGGDTGAVSKAGPRIPRVLSIAGSDSGAGAGVQADLKAFARCGVYGMTAITAVTAQSTMGVTAVHVIPPPIVVAQIRAVLDDLGVDAVKIGMLATAATVEAVADVLGDVRRELPIVLDPVLAASSGSPLLEPDALASLRDRLLPLASVATPNLPEARRLAGELGGGDDAELVRAIHALGPRCVVLTGGHGERLVDLFFDGERLVEIEGARSAAGATHGSGCTHSAALAAQLALGCEPLEAARAAQRVASDAIRLGLTELGAGEGPVDALGLRER